MTFPTSAGLAPSLLRTWTIGRCRHFHHWSGHAQAQGPTRLPGIGQRFELDTASGVALILVSHRSGQCDVAIADGAGAQAVITASLTRSESGALAMSPAGVHTELTTTPG
jgi:hypothetical protein